MNELIQIIKTTFTNIIDSFAGLNIKQMFSFVISAYKAVLPLLYARIKLVIMDLGIGGLIFAVFNIAIIVSVFRYTRKAYNRYLPLNKSAKYIIWLISFLTCFTVMVLLAYEGNIEGELSLFPILVSLLFSLIYCFLLRFLLMRSTNKKLL